MQYDFHLFAEIEFIENGLAKLKNFIYELKNESPHKDDEEFLDRLKYCDSTIDVLLASVHSIQDKA